MGRPRKCRICGYRFHSNEDICPECFTARDDDISCEQFGKDEHTHGAGFSTTESTDMYNEFKERSFVDEQRSEEANDPIPSATYGGRQGTPPPTYAQQSYNRKPYGQQNYNRQTNSSNAFYGGMQSRQDKLNALRNSHNTNANYSNTFYGNQNGPNFQQNNGNRVYYTQPGQQKKANGAVIAVLVILLLLIFFIPFVTGVLSAANRSTNKTKTTTTKKNNLNIEYSMPDLSLPNVSVPDVSELDFRQVVFKDEKYSLTAKHIETGAFISPDDLMNEFTDEEIKTHRVDKNHLPEGYRVLSMNIISASTDIETLSGPDIMPMGCYVETLDSNGHVICTSYALDSIDSGTMIENIAFLVPSDYYSFSLHILVNEKDKDADHKVVSISKFNIYEADDTGDDSTRTESDTSSAVKKKDKTA